MNVPEDSALEKIADVLQLCDREDSWNAWGRNLRCYIPSL